MFDLALCILAYSLPAIALVFSFAELTGLDDIIINWFINRRKD